MRDIFSNSIIREDMEDIFSREEVPSASLYNSTILVTGATGMLASYLVYYLIWLNETKNANITILALARSKEKLDYRFGEYTSRPYISCLYDDICEPINYSGDIDYIVHAASLASPQYYTTSPVEVATPNTIGTYYLLRLATEKKVKGFLFFSSGDVYGKMPEGIGAFSEEQMGMTDPLNLHSCYGESKRMGETLCKAFTQEFDVRTCIARIGHTYSPTMDIERDPRVFASFMKCVVNRENIVMLSDGSAKRPFCYIADAVAAFILLLIKGNEAEAYNLTNTDAFISISNLADIMVTLEPDDHLSVIRKARATEDSYLENKVNHANCPDNAKLKGLGWKCKYGVKEGFSRVLRYFREGELI